MQREPLTHNSITESECNALILARAYEQAGMSEARAWEAALADLAAGFGFREEESALTA